MLAKLYSSHFLFVAMVVSSFFTCSAAQAATRAILIPGKSAILIMEGFSSAGADPDVRRLYEQIAMKPVQKSGGEGKIITTSGKEFNLTCATRNSQANSIVCNITVKASPSAKIEFQQAEYHADGALAQSLNQSFGAGQNFRFEATDHTLMLESSPEHFDFTYHY